MLAEDGEAIRGERAEVVRRPMGFDYRRSTIGKRVASRRIDDFLYEECRFWINVIADSTHGVDRTDDRQMFVAIPVFPARLLLPVSRRRLNPQDMLPDLKHHRPPTRKRHAAMIAIRQTSPVFQAMTFHR